MQKKAKVVAAVWGTELRTIDIFHQDDMKKRMNRIKAICRKVCFKKWMIIQWFTPYKTTTLPKTCVQIIPAAKWLVRHSNTFPK